MRRNALSKNLEKRRAELLQLLESVNWPAQDAWRAADVIELVSAYNKVIRHVNGDQK
jgi:hypothetical protein